ncbi:MAG: Xaa-Pro peptidase family protein [Fimbriimonadaceae bacterium]|nr:Xaa-Pro peptidase family protein [Fimbriimonadaceae bacterium]
MPKKLRNAKGFVHLSGYSIRMSLTRQKLDQAADLVARIGVDVWLTFVRETAGGSDPVLPLIFEGGLTWQSALMVTRSGRKIAVVGNYDADPLHASGGWDEVIPYVQGIREPLLEVLERECGPSPRIAANFSPNDVKADGLTHGMYLLLQQYFSGTRFDGALESAEELVRRLRGVKTTAELDRIRAAIAEGDAIFALVPTFARIGVSEREVQVQIHRLMAERGLGFAWDETGDPIVNSGPDSAIGHAIPSESIRIAEGHVFHIDLGVIRDEYSSDIQRCWYVGDTVPSDVQQALEAVNAAISAGAKALRPGVSGWQVDEAARNAIVAAGYPEYLHALGHQVGRLAHDGGAVLGPRWERYGQTPFTPIEVGEVYTLELGVEVPGRGYLGIEEMVVVTESGCEFLSKRQLEMPCLC